MPKKKDLGLTFFIILLFLFYNVNYNQGSKLLLFFLIPMFQTIIDMLKWLWSFLSLFCSFLRGNFPLILFYYWEGERKRDRRKVQCAMTVTSDQIFILMVRAGQPTCIFAQLLPKGYNRNCGCKEYVERRCQYPDNRIHVAQWTQQARLWWYVKQLQHGDAQTLNQNEIHGSSLVCSKLLFLSNPQPLH